MLVFVYLVAVVLANLSVTYFGPSSTIINAFLLIGLDLTTRDALHERWQSKHLWLRIFGLIIAGSILSYLLNRNAGPVALASLVAFALSGLSDSIVYHALRRNSRFVRVNGSNVVSAAVDSIVFPTLAFGSILPGVVLGQFLAKVVGGYLWSVILRERET